MKSSNRVVRLGVDLGKNRFHLFGVDRHGQAALKRVLRRQQLVSFMARLEPCRIGLEACAGAHHWARTFRALGHEVRLISPQFVAPYVKGNKNDYNDAEGICEAVGRPGMRFVAVKTLAQQEVQALHRLRQSAIKWRTALANQLRGLLGEYGLVLPAGIGPLRQRVPELLEAGDNGLPPRLRGWLTGQYRQLQALDAQIAGYDREIQQLYRSQEPCQRIGVLPGVGPQVARRWWPPTGRAGSSKTGVSWPPA
jgi:transposase